MAEDAARARARRFEALTQAVWPAAQREAFEGWELRFTGGRSKRANSVQTTAAGPRDLASAIGHCEARYRAQGLRPVFKLTAASEPSGLDAALAARGYERLDETSVQTLPLDDGPAPECGDEDVSLCPVPSPEWQAVHCRLGRLEGEEQGALEGILERLVAGGGCSFASLRSADAMVAQGLGVVREGTVCLCEIGVAAPHRRRGHAEALVRALLDQARQAGAELAWLQVVADNEAALRLYGRLGFREAYRYWYRAVP